MLVRVARAGINFADTHQRENQLRREARAAVRPRRRGRRDGRARRGRFAAGERVVALLRTGGYAEYAVAPAARTFPIPDGVDDDAALALLIQGLTAWHLFRTSAQLQPGESVVVHSAAGGVGRLAVQLARPMGAGRVIATAGSEEKRERALELGADAAVDPAQRRPDRALSRPTAASRVDVVLEDGGRAQLRAEPAPRSPRSAGWSPTGSPRARRSRVSNGQLMKTAARWSASGSSTCWTAAT